MKYLEYNSDYWVLDIETDGLKPTKIYVVCVRNIVTGEEKEFYDKDTFLAWVRPEFYLVGHNILSYDIPALARLWELPESCIKRCVDTLVCSYLFNPALPEGHSLEAWGQRLKSPKIDFSDWSQLTPEMVTYCKQDVRLTEKVYKALVKKMTALKYSELSIQIEHKIRVVIDEQEVHGFWFDRVRASDFLGELRSKQSDLTKGIQTLFPPKRVHVAGPRKLRGKGGSFTAQYTKDAGRYEIEVDEEKDEYHCFEYIEFNLGSPKQRVERLLELGWEPENFTPKGFPKVDEDSLVKFATKSGRPEINALAEVLVLQGRSSMIETWLNNLGSDSRVHGRVLTCGATTRRMIHSSPNTANIPSGAKARYGHECRSFWGVEPKRGLCLVGYDAAGLETAGLCHYLNNPDATKVLLQSKPNDVHTKNATALSQALGWLCDREWAAKTSFYAWLYGAYPPKLGSIVGATKNGRSDQQAGEVVVDTFFRNVPGLKGLIDGVQYEWKSSSGRLVTIDGGSVICPSLNAALNYKIQSAGAIVMKLTSILLKEEAERIKLWFKRVGDIHDEGQLECHADDADTLGLLAVDCIRRAGRDLGFRVALDGDYKVGKTWAETH